MNKVVLVLFGIVLIVTLVAGGFYLFQTKNIPFLSTPTAEKTAQSLSKNCKDTGFSVQEKAIPYLDSLFVKVGVNDEKRAKEDLLSSVVHISGNCWSVWVGEPNRAKTGILYWEDSKGNLKQKKATIEL